MATTKNESWNDKKQPEKTNTTQNQSDTKNHDAKTKPCKNSFPV